VTAKHSRPFKPGEVHVRRGVFLLKRVFLPGVVGFFVLGFLTIWGQGWANALGPWLGVTLVVVLVLTLWFFVRAALAKLANRHHKALTAVRNQERYRA
jgi:uncharacterized membrane protein